MKTKTAIVVADTHVKRKRSYAKKGKSVPKPRTLQQLIMETSPEELPALLEAHGYGTKTK